MKISYCITCHNEDRTLKNLLERIKSYMGQEDEIIILDDFSTNPLTIELIESYKNDKSIICKLIQHALNKDYGTHKNEFGKYATGNWIFQLDSDECPHEVLLLNIKDIINSNSDIELYALPRVNDFKGVTQEDALRWGWRLTICKEYDNRPIVNFPDFQGRLFLNVPDRIKWNRRLHEKIEGYSKFANLPPEIEFSIYHNKTIETQRKTNIRYNEWFTEEENKGHGGIK